MQPMDHWQRVEAAMRGEATDRVPVALWRHFPEDDLDPGKLAARSLAWQERWDFDVVKFMPSGTYGIEDWGAATAYRGLANGAREVIRPAVTRTEDWLRLTDLDVRKGVYGQQNQALRLVASSLGGRVPILQTLFSPLTTARKLSTDRLYADLRRSPEALERALRVITDVTIRFALDALDAGAHGVFLAMQQATFRLLSKQEYERFGMAYDLQVFEALRGRTRFDMLHAHGEDIMFDLVAGYPTQMLNWHDRVTEPDLAQASSRYPGLLVGGLNENGNLLAGDERAIEAEVRDAIAQTGGRRLMIGPGCVVPVAVNDASIEAVLRAAGAAGNRASGVQ